MKRRSVRQIRAFIALMLAFELVSSHAYAQMQPAFSCDPGSLLRRASEAVIDEPPTVRLWHDIELGSTASCSSSMSGGFALLIELSAGFRFAGSLHELARRFAAVSRTKGLLYWSVTQDKWRTLVVDAYAVDAGDLRSKRPDFDVGELLSGETLYFRQDDSRSTGDNLYSFGARQPDAKSLIVEIRNEERVRLFLATVFDLHSVYSLHYLRELEHGHWGYVGVSAVRDGVVLGSESSFINRAATLYRYSASIASDEEPPVARR